MILHKFMKHISEQNWFAVGLDVLVVIVGIFLGLQVQNWYEDRGERELERNYLERLHSEIYEAEEYVKPIVIQVELVRDVLRNMAADYKANRSFSQFSNLECHSIQQSSITTNYIPPIATLDEMETTGMLAIISSEALRQQMTTYKSRYAITSRITTQLMNTSVIVPRKYPEIVDIVDPAGIFEIEQDLGNVCNTDLMNESPGFKNDLLLNITRYESFARSHDLQFEILSQLHDAIDQELGISHREATP